MAANLLFKMPLVATPSASDDVREVSPYKGGLGVYIRLWRKMVVLLS
jgi:hypothetical protein